VSRDAGTERPVPYAGATPGDIAVGFFNGDSYVDVAVISDWTETSSKIRILLGTAAGGFASGTTITTAPIHGDVIAGDFNADGKSDLAVAHAWSNNFANYPHVKTLHGNGDGTFTPVAYTSQIGTTAGTAYSDDLAPASSALLYKVRGISPSNVASEFSAPDLDGFHR
jgi:hypothetical protein